VPAFHAPSGDAIVRAGETPIYATLSIADGDHVSVQQNGSAVSLPAKLDNSVPEGCVWIPTGIPETQALGDLFGAIEVQKA